MNGPRRRESFPANGYGLSDMAGNVWEWTTDWYQQHGKIESPCCTLDNPRGGLRKHSYDPRQPEIKIPRKVTKGGSHLCAPNYCRRYRPAARMSQQIGTSTCHLGSATSCGHEKGDRSWREMAIVSGHLRMLTGSADDLGDNA